jgi:hypothetical protein
VIAAPAVEGVKFDATVGLNDEVLLLSAVAPRQYLFAAIAGSDHAAIQERCERLSRTNFSPKRNYRIQINQRS